MAYQIECAPALHPTTLLTKKNIVGIATSIAPNLYVPGLDEVYGIAKKRAHPKKMNCRVNSIHLFGIHFSLNVFMGYLLSAPFIGCVLVLFDMLFFVRR